jgi:multisubunit Na+/H+ antiporter MnhB subunit
MGSAFGPLQAQVWDLLRVGRAWMGMTFPGGALQHWLHVAILVLVVYMLLRRLVWRRRVRVVYREAQTPWRNGR